MGAAAGPALLQQQDICLQCDNTAGLSIDLSIICQLSFKIFKISLLFQFPGSDHGRHQLSTQSISLPSHLDKPARLIIRLLFGFFLILCLTNSPKVYPPNPQNISHPKMAAID